MSKCMIVTIGTSIFHSACWDKHNPAFMETLGTLHDNYAEIFANPGVTKDPGGLYNPEKRRKGGQSLESFFKKKLKGDDAGNWPEWVAPFDPPDSPAMRYSAEIGTILRYAENESEENDTNWQSILDPYEFYFVYDGNTTSVSGIAGLHNQTYLEKLLGGSPDRFKPKAIEGFSSKKPKPLVTALDEYRTFLDSRRISLERYETIDVVISGGYKIYGLIAYGFLSSPRFRIIYLHEEAEQVVIQDKDTMKLSKHPKRPFPAHFMKQGGKYV